MSRARTTPLLDVDTTWVTHAACRDEDPDLFAVLAPGEARRHPNRHHRIADAIAVCDRCPVRERCHAWAVLTKAEGVYGGRYFGTQRPRTEAAG